MTDMFEKDSKIRGGKPAERFTEILKTTDYSLFDKLLGNRKINEAHVLSLMQSMNHKQLIVPIIVNEKMQIIDGQHRFESCRRLGLPVYYVGIEGYRLEECHILNANNRTYKPEDFLEGYAALGYDEYKRFKEFRTKYPYLSMHICQIYLSGGQRRDSQAGFKNGDFKIDNWEIACLWAERTWDFKDYAPRFLTSRNFNTALLRMYKHKKYDHAKMMMKLSMQSSNLRQQAKEKQYVENLCEIYNYRAKSESEKIHAYEVYDNAR